MGEAKNKRKGVPQGYNRYTLTDDECALIAKASAPRLLTLADQRSPQELANAVWALIAEHYGFDVLSVLPDKTTSDPGTFFAKPQRRT